MILSTMQFRKRAYLNSAFVAVLLIGVTPASANACIPNSATPEVDVGGKYYVELECYTSGCFETPNLLLYEEANGISGLQRRDDYVDNTCRGQIPSDKLHPIHMP